MTRRYRFGLAKGPILEFYGKARSWTGSLWYTVAWLRGKSLVAATIGDGDKTTAREAAMLVLLTLRHVGGGNRFGSTWQRRKAARTLRTTPGVLP